MARVYRGKKKHHSERFRGPNLLVERWSNSKAGHVGFHLGQMRSYPEISKILNDGTSADTLRSLAYKWRLPVKGRKSGYIVSLSAKRCAQLIKQCEKRGIEPEEYLKRIADAVIKDDIFDAVVDGD